MYNTGLIKFKSDISRQLILYYFDNITSGIFGGDILILKYC